MARVNATARGIFTAAVGIALGGAVALSAGAGRTAGGDADGAVPAPSPGLSSDGAAGDANRLAGWPIIAPGSPAERYWGRHGVGVSDPYRLCEAALRVQFVRGYAGAEGAASDPRQPLWRVACAGVPSADRDSITVAATQWGATHGEGDE